MLQTATKTTASQTKIGNGTLRIPLGWRGAWQTLTIHGGPYNSFPGVHGQVTGENWFGVSVREEQMQGRKFDLHLPIKDFNVPRSTEQTTQIVKGTIEAALDGKQVYVGCMGGMGRTGLVLAVIAKAAGLEDPVTFVRQNYYQHAVETREQQAFVDKFDTTELTGWMYGYAWRTAILRKLTFWR